MTGLPAAPAESRVAEPAARTESGDDWRDSLAIPAGPRTHWPIVSGLLVILLFIVALGAWAALAPISSAAVAQGQLRVEGNRRTIQHLEGGIIREILVRDGAAVREGDVLLRLDDAQSGAASEGLRAQLDAALALDARLVAERERREQIAFPPALLARSNAMRVAEIIASQQAAFETRRRAIEGQRAILRQRVAQLQAEIAGGRGQVAFTERQMTLIQTEIGSITDLVGRGVIARPRLLALQREGAALSGQREQSLGAIARAEQGIGETEMQIIQLENSFMSEVATGLQDVRTRIADFEERLRGATDVQQRRDVVAPVAGVVTNLKFFTVGGVVRPGEPILDLVPRDETLVVDVRVGPSDIDVVAVGMTAEVRLTAFRQRVMPLLLGRVSYVSADVAGDARNEQRDDQRASGAFYRATIVIDPDEVRRLDRVTLTAGMPAEVLILAGERTMLSYLTQPLRDSLRRAFRDH